MWIEPQRVWRQRDVLKPEEHRALIDRVLAQESNFATEGDRLHGVRVSDEPAYYPVLAKMGELFSQMIPRQWQFGSTVVAHGDLNYLPRHRDDAIAPYVFTYYFRTRPSAFPGGELRVWLDSERFIDIEPEDNSLNFHAADLMHEMLPVHVPTLRFVDSRFSITCIAVPVSAELNGSAI